MKKSDKAPLVLEGNTKLAARGLGDTIAREHAGKIVEFNPEEIIEAYFSALIKLRFPDAWNIHVEPMFFDPEKNKNPSLDVKFSMNCPYEDRNNLKSAHRCGLSTFLADIASIGADVNGGVGGRESKVEGEDGDEFARSTHLYINIREKTLRPLAKRIEKKMMKSVKCAQTDEEGMARF